MDRTYWILHCLKLAETASETLSARPYGTLITVFTIVTDASNASTLPLIVDTVEDVDCPGLEIVIPG